MSSLRQGWFRSIGSWLSADSPNSNNPATPPVYKHFPLVDALRAVAALSVVVLHVIHHAQWTTFPSTGPFSLFRLGGYGVDLFFIISGFVVLYNAFGLQERYGSGFRTYFTVRRLARIAPLYFLTLAFYLFFVDDTQVWTRPNMWQHILTHAFFIHTFFFDTFSSINGVNWTIAVEMHFYIAILIFAPVLARMNPIALVVGSMIFAISWRYLAFVYTDSSTALGNFLLFIRTAQFLPRLDEFALGMAIAIAFRRGLSPSGTARRVIIAALLTCSLAFLYLATTNVLSDYSEALRFASRYTFFGIGFAALVLASCLVQSAALVSWLTPLRYIGKISYGIYLWHLPVIMLLKGHDIAPPVFLALTLAITLALAASSWHFFENPILEWGRRWETGRAKRKAAGARIISSGSAQTQR